MRLVTSVELDEVPEPDPEERRLAVSALLALEVTAGRRVVLFDDRGWAASGPPGLWPRTTADEIAQTARVVVGPDEPFDGSSPEEAAARYWSHLAATARSHGVDVGADALAALPHDVELGPGLRARLAPPPGR
ncbi:hypothetical protein [Kineococcus sp. SYSU DK004]|uniref:hypothetical protein n=1 Tax=Kineococcus sp. SYSU DK004 TaxID=3383125 RepID=UPI003D7E0764